MIERIKTDTNNADDIIYRNITIQGQNITLVYSEVLTSGVNVGEYVLKNLAKIIDENIPITTDLYTFFYNSLPSHNIKKIKDYSDLQTKLWNGYVIFILPDDNCLGMEIRASLDRGIGKAEAEVSIRGPKDAFTENFNSNLGLLRKRLKTSHLWTSTLTIGKQTQTKIGILYMENIAEKKLVTEIEKKLNRINIDGIVDSSYLKQYLNQESAIFPTIMTTERPDLTVMALLEGKIIILIDNSPYILILPCFFIDFFHTPDNN